MGAGQGVRRAAGGHCRVVEKCEGLSPGGLGATSREEVQGEIRDEIWKGMGEIEGQGWRKIMGETERRVRSHLSFLGQQRGCI